MIQHARSSTRAPLFRRNRRPSVGVAILIAGLPLTGCRDRVAGPEPVGELWAIPALPRASGPLRRLPQNPRYFSHDGEHAVYLTGSHTWANFQDVGPTSPPARFDYAAYLDSLVQWHHNYIRLYSWEQAHWSAWGSTADLDTEPIAYERSGPGLALDGRPRFDLTRFNESYFERLRERVEAARSRGLYVGVMLFNGWSVDGKGVGLGNPWRGHPFNGANNVNGVDGDLDRDGEGREAHTLQVPAVTRLQEAYIRKVVEALNGLDNVLYEVSNESNRGTEAWEYHVVQTISDAEARLPRQHPVGMGAQWPDGDDGVLSSGPADWVSPTGDLARPIVGTGDKVVLWDTDHVCGMCDILGADPAWIWKAMLNGLNPLWMDGWDGRNVDRRFTTYVSDDVKWGPIRRQLGRALVLAEEIDLARFAPAGTRASTGYCLADESVGSARFLVLVPDGRGVRVNLGDSRRQFSVEWLYPLSGVRVRGAPVEGGRRVRLESPYRRLALLYLREAAIHDAPTGAK